MEKVETPSMDPFKRPIPCEKCGRPFPSDQLIFVSVWRQEEGRLICVHCLLYFLGEVLGKLDSARL